jgi:hypothetical protein
MPTLASLRYRSRPLSPFGFKQAWSPARKPDRQRKAYRKAAAATAWIALDGGFAVRSCNVIDVSDTGVQIKIDPADVVPSFFTFMTSRDAGTGRRARVIWRRGSKIGAQFL